MSVHKVIEPLHVAVIGGHPLRFFRTPLDDGRPDFPWIAIDDLYRCLGLNRNERKFMLRSFEGRRHSTRIRTPGGTTIVVPHYHAQGAVGAMVEIGKPSKEIEIAYRLAGVEAMQKLVPANLEFPSDAWLDWMKAAMDRWDEQESKP
jgi:hypothetical protein